MYVANTTKQICGFHYRVDESRGARQQVIPPGRQIMLADMNLNEGHIAYIRKQHEQYGMRHYEEAARTRGFIPRLFSIDKPVPAKIIEETMKRNTAVLVIRGRDARKLAAVQANNAIEQQFTNLAEQTNGAINPELNSLDVAIEQTNDPRSPFIPSDEQPERVEEGFLVSRDADPEPEQRGKRNNKNSGNKRKAA